MADLDVERDRYRILIDAVIDYAIYMLDRDGIVISWNSGAHRLKQYSSTEIIGQHFSGFYTTEDKASGLPAKALAIAAREGRFESEGWRVRKDGSRFWAHVIIDAIFSPTGEVTGFAKVTRDLTERRAAEAALRQSQEQFRILVQGVTDYALYMLDPHGNITSWNPGAQRIKGYRPEEIIGEHFSKFYTPEDQASGEPGKALATAISEGKFEKEGWRVRKDGTRFWTHVVIDPIRDDSGKLIGFAKITRDITDKMLAAADLEKTRDALMQAQKMDAIGQLTGGVAHDFNNLLMAILGSLGIVKKSMPEDPRLTRLLDNAIAAADRGKVLTQRMLSFARRQEIDPQPTDIAALVHGLSDLLKRSLGPGIEIETRFPPSLPMVRVDANQLELAILNLAVNARDAMPEGGPVVIGARAETVEAPSANFGNYVCLSMTDSGEGMDEAVMARAAEPFFTTKGPGKGTGLGLAMVYGTVAQIGGHVTLRSKKGEGTCVELWLPVASSQSVSTGGTSVELPANPNRQLSILAVDDDALVLLNTAAMLEDVGHKVVEATSARQALEFFDRQNFDLVITDQAMPHMTGIQLAEEIRARRSDMPIIIATGYSELPPGAGKVLTKLSKPFTAEELDQAISQSMAACR